MTNIHNSNVKNSGRRQEAIALKCLGMTYAQIGIKLGISRQRAQQLIAPTLPRYRFIKGRAAHKCEDCGSPTESGHAHHVTTVINPGHFNDADNLVYLCKSCHSGRHNGMIANTPLEMLWQCK